MTSPERYIEKNELKSAQGENLKEIQAKAYVPLTFLELQEMIAEAERTKKTKQVLIATISIIVIFIIYKWVKKMD